MKILNHKEFLKLPSGILYTKFEPMVFDALQIKDDSTMLIEDYYYQNLFDVDADGDEWVDMVYEAMESKSSIPLHFYTFTRGQTHKENQLYAVLEKKDVEQLVNRLAETLPKYPEI